MHQLVPIGRFSQMTRLSIKALRHYDRIGLLRPAEVDPSSGYRYYRLTQARHAEAIRLLRGLDMSLDDIATVLSEASDQEVVAKVLQGHREQLAADLRAQQRRLLMVQRLINGEDPVMPYDVTTKTLDPVTIVGIRGHMAADAIKGFMHQAMGRLVATIQGSEAEMAGAPMALYYDVIDEEQSGELEIAIPIDREIEPGDDDVVCRTLDPVTAATTLHHGDYSELGTAYHVVSGWIAEHGHTPLLPAREIYVTDPSQTPMEDWVTEVQWPYE